eukprot:12028896-Alexandrium_andersonii.AAC.1
MRVDTHAHSRRRKCAHALIGTLMCMCICSTKMVFRAELHTTDCVRTNSSQGAGISKGNT